MYAATPDPYCYRGTSTLKNRAGLRDEAALEAFEAALVTQRLDEPLPAGRLSYTHYRAIHRHLFGDVYAWAGRLRTVRISKGGSMFCYPENIDAEMRRLFAWLKQRKYLHGLARQKFANEAAHFFGELNAIHPFREGNGRTQLAFLALLGRFAGHEISYHSIVPEEFMAAMIDSFRGDERALANEICGLIQS
jgi:cell filamentation protein